MQIGRLYLGFRRTNEASTRLMALWTQPSGYWKWTIFRQPYRSYKPSFGPSFVDGTKYRPMPRSSHFGCWVCLPFLGVFMFTIQPDYPKK